MSEAVGVEGTPPQRVVVVGAGISGLAAAHHIRRLRPDIALDVLEASDRPGGLLHTDRKDGFIVERGPDAILTEKPAAMEFITALGLESELVRTVPENRGAYVACRGHLERIPDGFSLLAPLSLRGLFRSPVLSPAGKLRASLDLVLPRGDVEQEESLEAFVTRRFGREVFERLAQPLVGGIYGADPGRLSLHDVMPRFRDAERSHRSVILGLKHRQQGASKSVQGARYGMFVSFREGMGTLPMAAAEKLGRALQLSTPVDRVVSREDGRFDVTARGRTIRADGVVLAVSSRRAAAILGDTKGLAAALAEGSVGSVATVTMAFETGQFRHPLDAYGYLVPVVEGRPTLAATWVSRKWPGRVPSGTELVRVFVGGYHNPEAVRWTDESLRTAAWRDMKDFLGVRGEPLRVWLDRYVDCMPHYLIGHGDRVKRLEAQLASMGALRLAGNSLHGVGIPDAIRQGQRSAGAVLQAISGH